MQVNKLRVAANGLVPAGAYFAAIASSLQEANTRAAEHQAELDQEDRDLENLYRRHSASRTNVYAEAAA
ncbi:MAG: hypothetical protein AB7O98_10155 [Hyphomonadaceae bacterium]